MASENKLTLIGNLGMDPELKTTTTGRMVTTISVATTETWKDKSGNRQERTEWHRVVAWGQLAELVAKHLQKGSKVYVTGPLRSREFTDKEQVKRKVWELVADQVLFLDRIARQTDEDKAAPSDQDVPF